MVKFIIYNNENIITEEIFQEKTFDIEEYILFEKLIINNCNFGRITSIDYEEKIIYTDDFSKFGIKIICDYCGNDTIDNENMVIFKPINKNSKGYLHLIEDAEYTIDFLDVEDNLVYLFDYNDISFHAPDFINKNSKLRITVSDKEDEHNFEKYKDDDFSIDGAITETKCPETLNFIETQYNSYITEIDEISFKIIDKRKQKANLDKEISDLETNILEGRKMIKKFEIMINELKQ